MQWKWIEHKLHWLKFTNVFSIVFHGLIVIHLFHISYFQIVPLAILYFSIIDITILPILRKCSWIKKGTLLSLVNEGDIVTVIPVCICHKISQEHLHGFS
jgi:hypothetical protein